jgi:hypothetical protein
MSTPRQAARKSGCFRAMTIWRRCLYPPEKTAGRAQHHLAQERGDIGNYSIGSAVMVMWPSLMVFLAMSFFTRNLDSDFSQGILILGRLFWVFRC